MPNDQKLIRQLKRGRHEALSRIYETYRDDLLRLALALLHDAHTAEDIVHDVFLQFVRSIRQFRLTGSLKGYLATCVANRARNEYKARQSARRNTAQIAASEEKKSRGPEDWIVSTEQFSRISSALEQLPYDQREAVTLHIYGKMTFREIAASQDVSIKTTRSRYRYGLDKLYGLLNHEAER
ncbi:MAG: RNA polymerase sigma factor [Planctomycetota bacterium]|jgi:RNA polymerase sigma-70 factor (ECF subfamily)